MDEKVNKTVQMRIEAYRHHAANHTAMAQQCNGAAEALEALLVDLMESDPAESSPVESETPCETA